MNILMSKKTTVPLFLIAALILVLLGWRCFFSGKKTLGNLDPSVALMLDWHDYALLAERRCEGYRAPVVARIYAYSGLAAWEAARPVLGGEALPSFASQFNGLKLPAPDPSQSLHLPTVLNACYSNIFLKFFLFAPRDVEQKRLSLEQEWATKLQGEIDSATYLASADFGKKMALAIYDWSASDTVGHMAYLHNYDGNYSPPAGTAFWQPCEDFPMPPLLPRWAKSRCFVINPEDFIATPPPPFSMEPQSPYYVQALEVYTINSPLSPENQWIAEFWSDDLPGLTFTSAGRWVSISNQVIRLEKPAPIKALETYLQIGFALNDATVACWISKYRYNLLRPETFIRRTIQPDWRPVVHTPSHPSYPSGHAMIAAAAAEVLTNLYGKHYDLTDRSHENRSEFKGKPRRFHSFYEMAFENAASRIALGVHYRMDCDEGTRLGLGIGKEVAKLPDSDSGLEK